MLITRQANSGKPLETIRQDNEEVVATEDWQEVRVRGVGKVRQGLLVRVADSFSAERLTSSSRLQEKGLVATPAQQRNPRIAITGLERDCIKEQLTEDFYKQNFQAVTNKEDYLRGFRLAFQIGRRDAPRTTWVAEVTPDILEQGRIYRGWTS